VHFWRKAVFYVGREADRTLVSVIVGFLKVEIHLVFLLTFLYAPSLSLSTGFSLDVYLEMKCSLGREVTDKWTQEVGTHKTMSLATKVA
jgi:hypothetical protein